MKIGFNLLLWTTHVTAEHDGILRKLKATGYDGVEIPMFEGDAGHYARLGERLQAIGLERTVVSIVPSIDKNPISADAAHRKAAVEHLKWVVDCSAALGAKVIGGPLHSTLGYFSGNAPTPEERSRAVEFHKRVGDYAGGKGVTIALEALNRFECYFLNTMADLCAHLDAVGHPAVTGMYDTFHANIEEKDPVGCIEPSMHYIKHVHISENDRGTPGKGHVDWKGVYRALKGGGYDGWLTIEAFGRALPALAAATRVWRDFFPSSEEVFGEGFKNIRDGWARA
jgi:D-psicose/D-tagatose/L-ribulose 3-epimerase